MIQIVKQGAECWVITSVETRRGAHEYETIGRVRRDGAMFVVDLPLWAEETFTWERQPRSYLLPEPAFKFVINEHNREKVVQ